MSGIKVVNKSKVLKGLKEFLVLKTGRPISSSYAPLKANGDLEDFPYAVIHQVDTGTSYEQGFNSKESHIGIQFLIRSFGLRDDQALWMSDRVAEVLVGKGDSQRDGFLYELPIEDHKVTFREIIGSSGKLHKEGNAYVSEDSYLLSVTSEI